MSERRLSVAVAGAGLMGEWHARYARRLGADLIAVVDPDRSRHSSGRFGDTKFFDSAEAMLEQRRPHAVHVCSPTDTHRSQSELFLQQGIHVLCEKPVAETLVEVEDLIAIARRNDVAIVPVHQFVFQRGVVLARAELERVGDLLEVEVLLRTAGGEGRDEKGLYELVGEVLPHPLSLLDCFGVLPADGWAVEMQRPGELRVHGSHEGRAVAVNISAAARPARASMQLAGTAATMEIDLFHGFRAVIPGNVSRGRKILAPFSESSQRFSAAAVNLARRALRRETAYPGLLDLISGFYASIEKGRSLPISCDSLLKVSRARDQILGVDLR